MAVAAWCAAGRARGTAAIGAGLVASQLVLHLVLTEAHALPGHALEPHHSGTDARHMATADTLSMAAAHLLPALGCAWWLARGERAFVQLAHATHTALLFGLPNQLALAALMAAVLLLLVRGYRMWWQRRPVGRAGGKPVPRGGLRALPARLLVPLVAVTLLVGWFLPLLGISLAVFLVADTLVGLRSRRRTAGRAPAG
ncbi:PepSY domain-containing protein [Streptomyces albidoflavus]|uniref:PepSY domain-containing protein n=1 Tax=Streptomyces TaxID=1883 RepID=UPI001F19D8FB|nr:PepSY domain-containing protein [Streptomyces sp. KE1]